MAIKLDQFKKFNCVEIISQSDDAVDTEESDFDEYQATGDQKHLVFVDGKQPTKFICNFEMKGKQAARIKNAMVGGHDEETKRPKVTIGDWSFKVVKYVLKDIQNPEGLEEGQAIKFRKDKDGYVHDEVLVILDRIGVVSEIFTMYSNLVGSGARDHTKN